MRFPIFNKLQKKIFCATLLPMVSLCIKAQSFIEVLEMSRQQSTEAQIAEMKFQYKELAYRYYNTDKKPLISFSTTPIQYNKDIIQRYSYDEDCTYYRTQNSLHSSANIRLTQNAYQLGGFFYIDSDTHLYKSLGKYVYKQFTATPLRLGYSQTLVGYNPFKWQKRTEELSYTIAEKELLHCLEDITTDAVEMFIIVELLCELRKLAESNLYNCDTLCLAAEKKIQYGRLSRKDYAELLLERSKAYNTYQKYSLELIEAESSLKRVLNLSEEDTLDVTMLDIIQNIEHVIDIPMSDAIQFALENSTDILVAEKNILEARQDVERLKVKRYLDATINVSIGLHQISETLQKVYRHPLDEQTASVSMSIPLADFGRGRILYSQARTALAIQSIQTKRIKDDVRELIKKCVLRHSMLYSIINDAQQAYHLSCVAYNETLAEYHLGRWSANSLSEAVANRQEALVEYYQAIRDYLLNYFQIRNMTLFDFEKNECIKKYQDKASTIQ